MSVTDFHITELEWEAPVFPLTLYNLRFPGEEYQLNAPLECHINRNSEYQLTGEMRGPLKHFTELKPVNFVGKGNIIKGCTAQSRILQNTLR